MGNCHDKKREFFPEHRTFRVLRIRFFVCLKILEREFQRIFNEVGITNETIINSYPAQKLAAFLKKRL
jgi:hypothetical protein